MSQVEVGAAHPEADPPATARPAATETGARRRTDLPGTPSAVSIGRDFTRRALTDWGWLPDQPDTSRQTVAADILLVVSEILANASMHAGGARELVLDSGEATGAFRLEVVDGDPKLPTPPKVHQPGLPGGHGLLIVEKLSDRWGVIPGTDGKTVWAEVDLSRLQDDLTA
jgi:anti-sigma regulatory factor (Ser/Thr protein kinase)